jgi:prepilin-type N-terminal cleavage/methylation domain-containing protein
MSYFMRKPIPSSASGFTLVEMAIVMAIIGLLTAGILKAAELYHIVQVRRVYSDINSISAATKGFQEKYGSVPGDFPLALTRLAGCDASTHCVNGNGDSMVGKKYVGDSGWDQNQAGITTMPEVETSMFWKHLVLGGFLRGVNQFSDPAQPQFTMTHPETGGGIGGFAVFSDTQSAGSSISIRIQKNVAMGVDPRLERPFTVKQAMYMDQKYDDGRANAGYMWGIPYAGVGDPPCRKSWSGSNGEQYNLDPNDNVADQNVCQFHFIFH